MFPRDAPRGSLQYSKSDLDYSKSMSTLMASDGVQLAGRCTVIAPVDSIASAPTGDAPAERLSASCRKREESVAELSSRLAQGSSEDGGELRIGGQ